MKNEEKTELEKKKKALKCAETPKKSTKIGRPRKTEVQAAEDALLRKIKAYLDSTQKIDWSLSGLARVTGYRSAKGFIRAAREKGGALGYGLLKIEEKGEEFLFTKCYPGAIFLLKQLGWEDTQKVETENKTVSINIQLSDSLEALMSKLDPAQG